MTQLADPRAGAVAAAGGGVELPDGGAALGEQEWAALRAGVVQHKRALERFLAAVHRPRPGSALAGGGLPRRLVAGSSRFSPAAVGVEPVGGVRLPVCAVDLLRTPDGALLLLGVDAAVPAGAEEHPQPVLAALRAAAPSGVEDPFVVVLTGIRRQRPPDALLARSAGLPLVEAADLHCRGGQVQLRTTAGSRPVHVVLRRVADDLLDPLHARDGAALGCPGLVGAARAGAVALVPALGGDLAADPAVTRATADLVRHHLGEEPLLEAAPPGPRGALAGPGQRLRVLVVDDGACMRVLPTGAVRVLLPETRPSAPGDARPGPGARVADRRAAAGRVSPAAPAPVLARTAGALFRAAAHLERADAAARLLEAGLAPAVEAGEPGASAGGSVGASAGGSAGGSVGGSVAASVVAALTDARTEARRAGERLPAAALEALEATCAALPPGRWRPRDPRAAAAWVCQRTAAVTGTAAARMRRDDAWLFWQLGLSTGRAAATARLLAAAAAASSGGRTPDAWAALLGARGPDTAAAADGAGAGAAAAVQQLLLDRLHPRSAVHALARAERCLAELGAEQAGAGAVEEASRRLGRARAELEYRPLADLAADPAAAAQRLQRACAAAAEALTRRCFPAVPGRLRVEELA
ncbi:circularly permuted type 2 ATP-grasp protein [Quadrisphaera sp. DSM 44207]|uniref:circularly permuted type 2 ATP-grasp protein n=1 Tax=Quadrisphaera sp. DSM 44207 TaxID=1881057 RepID=UPI00088786DD|nr:circularly permuted type 2 ATP-grasp protein [Quadrisphaera sp. DSM 44207]SDQ04943.1 Circularly permuted ATP-grasp type 2 [Quadrisphaera sp. DSM 44207]